MNDEKYLLQKTSIDKMVKEFIHTGDGGFQIFDNPIQALLFIAYFQANLSVYNSFRDTPVIRDFVGPLSVRFCITTGNVFAYNENFFGDSIITNARILSRDKLNRCLIDENTYRWFENEINGIESLECFNLEDISRTRPFIEYDRSLFGEDKNTIINEKENNISSIICSKVGVVRSKSMDIDVYNLYFKTKLTLFTLPKDQVRKFSTAIGNTNVSGIENKTII